MWKRIASWVLFLKDLSRNFFARKHAGPITVPLHGCTASGVCGRGSGSGHSADAVASYADAHDVESIRLRPSLFVHSDLPKYLFLARNRENGCGDCGSAAGPNNSSIQARSSGRKPDCFWLPRQFFRSIFRCAIFQSPQMMYSRRSHFLQARQQIVHVAWNLISCLSSPLGARLKVSDTTDEGQNLPAATTSFMIHRLPAKAVVHAVRLNAAVMAAPLYPASMRRDTRRGRPTGWNSGLAAVDLGLGFLHAHHVCLLAHHPLEKALARRRADTVHVDCYDAHQAPPGEPGVYDNDLRLP